MTIKFKNLKFKERVWGMDELACALSGMTCGTSQAFYTFDNDYSISVLTDTYLCTKNTYEIGILNEGVLCTTLSEKTLHNRLIKLGLQHDKSISMVYGKVTKKQIEQVLNILEFYRGEKYESKIRR